MSTPDQKAQNRLWHLVASMVQHWEEQDGVGFATCARQMREVLKAEAPRKPGRPRSKGWVPGT